MNILKRHIRWQLLSLIGIGILSLCLRLYGLNWDQGNSFHPDERQIMFHVTTLHWPQNLAQFFDPVSSPLNPHFFAYGSFPLYLLALLDNILSHFSSTMTTFANMTLVGRVLSALFDSGTVVLTGWLALLLVAADHPPAERQRGWTLALLSSLLVAFTPLQVQVSHFFIVESLLLFFIMLTLLGCVALVDSEVPLRWSLVIGLGYGLALATKFSAVPLAIPLLVALLMRWHRHGLSAIVLPFSVSVAATCWIFVLTMPYALLDHANFVQQVAEQGSLVRGTLDLPYVRQFANTIPYLYEAQNMLLWGMGLMLGFAALAGLLWVLWRVGKRPASLWAIPLSWVLTYSIITGSFSVKFMRYMLPIYPCLTLMAAAVLLVLTHMPQNTQEHQSDSRKVSRRRFTQIAAIIALILVVGGTAFQGVSLLNVYSQPNTRIQASLWMYHHLRPGSLITYEQWDDPLPVPVGGSSPSLFQQATYTGATGQSTTGLDLYSDDTLPKAQQLANLLPTIDVIAMSSDRLDKSIPRLPSRYPLTIHYYQLLFGGQLGFHLAAQFENHPHLFGVTFDDSNADESYSVFDHPHVRIFVRNNPYPYTSAQLFQKLLTGVQLP